MLLPVPTLVLAAGLLLAPASAGKTIKVESEGTASNILLNLASPSADVCAGGDVALSPTCSAVFRCSEAAKSDGAVFEGAAAAMAVAIGPVIQECRCGCGTYCCPYCFAEVPAEVDVGHLAVALSCL